ncbi:DUF2461 domain-containing protein [Schleiferia thermophila]|uniref:DUF2461 domain-containing protein n=1 Tax=Schleiferia thermophila TaxID=884107 RepID=UPI002FD8D568
MLSKESIKFLENLRDNNHKDWFSANRTRYEYYKTELLQAARQILKALQQADPSLADVKPHQCLFRINRDIRFSPDNRPYKTHVSLGFAPGGRKGDLAGYYVHFDPEESFVGGGLYMPMSEPLKKVRTDIDLYWDEFTEILHQPDFVQMYGDLDFDPHFTLSRPPKGYTYDHPAIRYLKLKSFTATRPLRYSQLTEPATIELLIQHLLPLRPLLHFLNRALQADDEPNIILKPFYKS